MGPTCTEGEVLCFQPKLTRVESDYMSLGCAENHESQFELRLGPGWVGLLMSMEFL